MHEPVIGQLSTLGTAVPPGLVPALGAFPRMARSSGLRSASTRRQASGPVRARFYLPAVAGIVVLVSALMLTRRVPRWAGALLVAIYIAFAAGGYLLYDTQPTGARANQAATHGSPEPGLAGRRAWRWQVLVGCSGQRFCLAFESHRSCHGLLVAIWSQRSYCCD